MQPEFHGRWQVEVWQRQSAAEMLACRFEVSDLQRQCGELRGARAWWSRQYVLIIFDN